MTDSEPPGHPWPMAVLPAQTVDFSVPAPADARPTGMSPPVEVPFRTIYADHFTMVWRALVSLGVRESDIEDALQDVFLVAHRRFDSFDGSSSLRTWFFGIVLRVARNHRRSAQRKGGHAPLDTAREIADARPDPHEEAAASEALRRVASMLETLDEAKREVFVLADLEEMPAPEIAEALGTNVNTVYSRLRAARKAVEAAMNDIGVNR